jgi:cytochrome c peroxidase
MHHFQLRAPAGALLALLGSGTFVFAADESEGGLSHAAESYPSEGQRLFELETFGGNGRSCLTCHSRETGTVSPADAERRFCEDPDDPLFAFDGSDDGQGNGVSRMLADATISIEIPLPSNVRLADDPGARSVVLRRGIPTTLNTPALDPVLMLDGRQSRLEDQAADAIAGHAQATTVPTQAELESIAEFQRTELFFSSPELREFARGGAPPGLPEGQTAAERRGRRFFEDLPPGADGKDGLCAACHSGPLLNQTNPFLPVPVPVGTRFIGVLVSELNAAGNPMREFVFDNGDGTETLIPSPDPGRALITGAAGDANAFKISSLRGVSRTAPYFHDNSAKTLADVAAHYARFFAIVTAPDSPGPAEPAIVVTPEEQADMVAYMKLL